MTCMREAIDHPSRVFSLCPHRVHQLSHTSHLRRILIISPWIRGPLALTRKAFQGSRIVQLSSGLAALLRKSRHCLAHRGQEGIRRRLRLQVRRHLFAPLRFLEQSYCCRTVHRYCHRFLEVFNDTRSEICSGRVKPLTTHDQHEPQLPKSAF